MRIRDILTYLCIPIPLCINQRFVFSQPSQGRGRGKVNPPNTPQPQATPRPQPVQPVPSQPPQGQQKKQGSSGTTTVHQPQTPAAPGPQPSKTQNPQPSQVQSAQKTPTFESMPKPEQSNEPPERRLGVDYFTPPNKEYSEDHSTVYTLGFAFNLQLFTKPHLEESENDVSQYTRHIGSSGFIYKFKDGANCVRVRHGNLTVWDPPEGSGQPEFVEFAVGTPCHILIKTPKEAFNYRKVDNKWVLCSYTTYTFSYLFPTLVDILTADTIYEQNEKKNDELKYILNTEDKYRVFYFEFYDTSYCRKLYYNGSIVWTHNVKLYGHQYPKRIYLHKDDPVIVVQFKEFYLTYNYATDGWKYSKQVDYKFNEKFMKITTVDPNSYNSYKENDESQYTVLRHYFATYFTFKNNAKCLSLKYSETNVWERNSLFEDYYPKLLEYNHCSRNFIIHFDVGWYYHYSFDPDDEKWYLDDKQETSKPEHLPDIEFNRPSPEEKAKPSSQAPKPKQEETIQLQKGVKVTVQSSEQDEKPELEQEEEQDEKHELEQEQQEKQELEGQVDELLQELQLDQEDQPPDQGDQPLDHDLLREKALLLRDSRTEVLTSENEPLKVDQSYDYRSLEQALGCGLDEYSGLFELTYEYDKYRKVVGLYFNNHKIWRKTTSEPFPKSITFLSDIFMGSINFTEKQFYIFKYKGYQWDKIKSSVESTIELDIASKKGSLYYLYGELDDVETYLVRDKYLFNKVLLTDSNYRGVKNRPLWEATSPVEYSDKVEVTRKLGRNLKWIEVTIYFLTGCELTLKSPGWYEPFTTISWSETSFTIDDDIELISADDIKGENPIINDIGKMDVYKYKRPNGNESKTYKYLINLYCNCKCLQVSHKKQIVWKHDGKNVNEFPTKIIIELETFSYHFEFNENTFNFTTKLPESHVGLMGTNGTHV